MPPGPLFTHPGSLYESFKREIIIKNPEVFKIKVLKSLQRVFSDGDYNPLYSGFGNKDSDAISYTACGVSPNYVFTITPEGLIYLINSSAVYSYPKLNELID